VKQGQQITYKGKAIWIMDAANKDEKACLEAWEDAKQVLAKERDGLLALIDCRNAPMTPATVKKAVEVADMVKGDPRFCVAFVGLTGISQSTAQVFAKTRHVHARFFDTAEDAKEWLVKEAEKLQKG
jgi:hypothetical protein